MISDNTKTTQPAAEATLSPEELERVERRARRFWLTFVVGFLSLQVVIGITSIVLATNDPTVAVIPNYHSSAVNWDTTRRSRQLTNELGWTVTPVIGEVVEGTGRREFAIKVVGPNQDPISDLNLTAKLFHHARGAAIYELKLDEAKPGVYVGMTKLTQAGLWQVQVQMEGDHGIASISREVLVQ